jgi:monoamine oxidase
MRKSCRSALTRMLREADAAVREARLTGVPLDEVAAMRAGRAPTRRNIITGAMAGTAALLLPRRSSAIGQPRVAIIGGGIAGLSCAHRLWSERRIQAQIYEWDDRAGGRIETLRGYFANGQTTEQHAEFISSEHSATLGMAQRFGLTLENTYADPKGMRDTYWLKGARYDQKALNRDWQDFGWKLFRDAVREAPGVQFDRFSHKAYQWDHMSVPEWIEKHVPGGLNGDFGKLCYMDVISEYGGPPENQSALNLVYLLGYNDSTKDGHQSPKHPMLAGSDEKWHIRGGNDQLIDGLVSRLPEGTMNFGHQLIALAENPDGSFTCTFDRSGSTVEEVADHVVLTMPFTTLRKVDLAGVTISDLKRTAIAGLELGNNVKIQIQVAGRPWTKDGYTGDTITDAAVNGSWDGTTYQSDGGNAGTEILIAVPGGSDGAGLASKYGLVFGQEQGPAPAALINDTLSQLEPILPGITAAWSAGPKLAWVNDGNIDEHFLGAWSQYNIGQYTGFSGVERLREGNIHFAGEHTSIAFQGFIEGAVRSGHRAANEI